MFVRDSWYVAGWSEQIGREPVGYIMLNEPVVLFRKKDSTPVALEDRCAHRRLPLSKGKVVGDHIECGYHGLVYGDTGACIHVPGQSPVPPYLKVRTHPVLDRHGCIWVWMGDPTRADPTAIPDLSSGHLGWGDKQRLHVKCHYQLISDNLGDLSHLAYVHAANVGNTALAEHGEIETTVSDNQVVIARWTLGRPPPPTYREVAGFNAPIDRWQISHFFAPSFFRLTFGAASAGRGRDALNHPNRWGFCIWQWSTPETERTSHYYWAGAPNFGPERDTRGAALYFPQQRIVVGEDIAIFEAQQTAIDLDPDAPVGRIMADAAVIAARDMVTRLVAAEKRKCDEHSRPNP